MPARRTGVAGVVLAVIGVIAGSAWQACRAPRWRIGAGAAALAGEPVSAGESARTMLTPVIGWCGAGRAFASRHANVELASLSARAVAVGAAAVCDVRIAADIPACASSTADEIVRAADIRAVVAGAIRFRRAAVGDSVLATPANRVAAPIDFAATVIVGAALDAVCRGAHLVGRWLLSGAPVGRAAKLLPIAGAKTAGVIATFGVRWRGRVVRLTGAAIGPAFIRRVPRADALRAIPGLPSRAGDRFRRRSGAPRGVRRLVPQNSACDSRAAKSQQALEHAPAAGSGCQRPRQRIEPAILHALPLYRRTARRTKKRLPAGSWVRGTDARLVGFRLCAS
jgi:hypothetical protein